MTALIVYLGIGVLAVLQAFVRNWRRRLYGLEGVLICVGAVVLWLPMFLLELHDLLRSKKPRPRRDKKGGGTHG